MNRFSQWLADGGKLEYDKDVNTNLVKVVKPATPVRSIGCNSVRQTVSNRLRSDIRIATGVSLTDEGCLQYLQSLDDLNILDSEDIITTLAARLPLPAHIREQYPTHNAVCEWLRPLVELVVMLWIDDDLQFVLPLAVQETLNQDQKKKILTGEASIVITCHNYARYLTACLRSVFNSRLKNLQVIVVDDSSDDDPKSVCDQFPDVRYVRCDVRNPLAATAAGMSYVTRKYVCFLDADDVMLPGYLSEAMRLFETDPRIAVTYPVLQCFGAETGIGNGTQHLPASITIDSVVASNCVSSGAVFRTTAVLQSRAFDFKHRDPGKCYLQDWHIVRAVLNSGASWRGVRMKTPTLYRRHDSNRSSTPLPDYWGDAYLQDATVTVVTAFSGRWDCWPRLREWLHNQTWPKHQLRLLIINTTHAPLNAKMLGLENWGSSLQIERLDVGRRGLADEERRNRQVTCDAVEVAVTSIYNNAVKMLLDEYVLFLEDDVIPQPLDAIEKLLQQMGVSVAGVSGVYQHRYHPGYACAFTFPNDVEFALKPLDGSGVLHIDGSGFGCLLTRRSLLRRFPLVTDGPAKFYDCQFSSDCKSADNGRWKWLLHYDVQCDHMLERTPPATHGDLPSVIVLEPEPVTEVVIQSGNQLKKKRNRLRFRGKPNSNGKSITLRGPRKKNRIPDKYRLIPVNEYQCGLYRDALAVKPAPDPFTDTPVLHFGAHLWPIKDRWEHHVDKWNEVAELVNGKCIVGVAISNETVSFQEVRARLSPKFEAFEQVNIKTGENQTFIELQKRIPTGHNDVLIYCHGKGVRNHTVNSAAVRIWTELMYETVVFNHAEIIRRLGAGYKSFGSFRTFGFDPKDELNKWHYSGTFFAVRAKYLRNGVIQDNYCGVEGWPGTHIPACDAWNEIEDNCQGNAQYRITEIYPRIITAGGLWEIARIGGAPLCHQHKRELDWFLDRLEPTDHVLVIGSWHGGVEHQIKKRYPWITTLSIDTAPQEDNAQDMIVGDSHDPLVQQQCIDAGPFDVVFIDGDHSYTGVAADWAFAQRLTPRIVAFHDIATAYVHQQIGCQVDQLWSHIKSLMVTEEKIVGCGWGGIGVVHMPHRGQLTVSRGIQNGKIEDRRVHHGEE